MSDVAPVEDPTKTAAYQECRARLWDREKRLDSLYWIKDENGEVVLFKRNEAQRAYNAEMWSRDLIVKARRLGFSTFIAILFLDTCMFRRNTEAAIIDVKLDSAINKLAVIKFAYERLPEDLRKANPLLVDNKGELAWANGSKVTVGTSYRGGGLQCLHVSEYGKISINTPDAAKEIKNGSMPAVPPTGFLVIESTAHGTAGEFYDMVKAAEVADKEGRPRTALNYKLHFYGWWIKREHRLPNNLVTLSVELRKYFAEIAPRLKSRHGVALDADQMAWYATQYAALGPDDTKEEFPSVVEETFFNSIEGAFWKEEIARARRDKRIGLPLPFDPTRRVNTAWDIGEDGTSIVFHQGDGVRNRIIDYWEMEGASLQLAAGILDEKKVERGFLYATHYGPHDLDNKDWAHESKTRKQVALELGIKFEVVPRVVVKADSIEAARRLLNSTWICSEHAGLFVERIENYRKRWNKALGVFTSDPVHDMSSHPADAYQQLAMGLKPEKLESSRGSRDRPKRSQWGA